MESTSSYLNTTFSTSVDSRLDSVEGGGSGSTTRIDALELYTSSLKIAISASGQDLVIYGNLTVQGTHTSISSSELSISDKTITIAAGAMSSSAADGGGIIISGAAVEFVWSDPNQRMTLNKPLYVKGELSGSELSGIGNVTLYSTSVNSRLVTVEAVSSSAAQALNGVSGAIFTRDFDQDTRISSLETNVVSASTFSSFSTSVDNRLDVVEATSSYYNGFSTSVNSRLTVTEATSSLYTAFSTSVDGRLDIVEATSSLYDGFSTSVDSRLDIVEATASYYVGFSTSVDSRVIYLETTFSTSVDSRLDVVEATASYYVGLSTSVDARLDVVEATASYYVGFSTSVDSRLDNIEGTFSTSVDSRLGIVEATASYYVGFSASVDSRLDVVEATASYYSGFSTSVDSRLDNIEGTFSTSVDSRLDVVEATSSLYDGFSTSVDSRLDIVESTASYYTGFSTSVDSRLDNIEGTFSTSVDSRLDSIETTFSTSVDLRLDVVEATASLYDGFSTSVDSRLDVVEATASYYVGLSTSVDSRLDVVEATASYYVDFSTSVDSRLDSIEGTFSTSVDSRLDVVEATASYYTTFSTSVSSRLINSEIQSASFKTFTGSVFEPFSNSYDSDSSSFDYRISILTPGGQAAAFAALNNSTASLQLATASLYTFTQSYYSDSSSFDSRLDSIEGITGSYATTGSNRFNGNQTITGSIIASSLNLINERTGTFAYFDTASTLSSVTGMNLVNNQHTIALGMTAYTLEAPERLIVDNSGPNSYNIATFQTSQNEVYAAVNIKNFGSGSAASADLVIWNDVSTESSSFLDLGINSSIYTAGDVGYGGDGYLYNAANDLYIGTFSSNNSGHLHMFAGGLWQSSSISIYGDGTIGFGTDILDNHEITIPSSSNGYSYEFIGNTVFDGTVKFQNGLTGSLLSTNGVVSGSSQITYSGINSIPVGIISGAAQLPAGTVSGSSQILGGSGVWSGSAQLPNGTVSGSSQITYSEISSIPIGIISGAAQLPNGTVSGSSQVLGGSGVWSGSSQLPNGVISGSSQLPAGTVSGSSQITYSEISSIPAGIVSGSSQVLGGSGVWSGSAQMPAGVVSGSSQVLGGTDIISSSAQLNNATITNLTVTNLTTVNETASVIFSSGSNKFGDFGDDVHQFTGSVTISGSLSTIGASSAASFNGTINANNGVISGSSQLPLGIISGSSQLPAGTVSGSSQVLGGTDIWSSSAQLPAGTVSGSSQVLGGSGVWSGSAQLPLDIISGAAQLPAGTVSGSSQVLGGTGIISSSNQLSNLGYAITGSNRFNGNQTVTGSLTVSGSLEFDGALHHIGNKSLTGSFLVSGSTTQLGNNTLQGNTLLSGTINIVGDSSLTGSFLVSGSTTQLGNNTLQGNTLLSGTIGITGNSTLTGSFLMSGSTTQVGNNTLLGNTLLSGSIIISSSYPVGTYTSSVSIYGDTTMTGYLKIMPHTTNIDPFESASYIYVSGSTNDLHFSQNAAGYANTTRLRWLEGNLYTGLLNGGVITSQSATSFQVSSGSGIIVNMNGSLSHDPYPTIQYLNWGNLSASIASMTSSYDQCFVAIDSTSNIFEQGTPFTDGQFDTLIPIGVVFHQNRTSINGVVTKPHVAYAGEQRATSFINAFGPLKLSGFTLAVSGSSTGSLVVGSGTAFLDGGNYLNNPNDPSYVSDAGTSVSKIFRYRQSGSAWVYDSNLGAGYTTVDTAHYSLNGVLTTMPTPHGNNWQIQRCYYFAGSPLKPIIVYYGNTVYPSEVDAIANIPFEAFVEAPNTAANGIYLGAIITNGNSDFTVPSTYTLYPGGLFRQVGGSGGAGSTISSTLFGLTDVSIAGPTNGQPLTYSSTAAKWVNSSVITASVFGNASTATLAATASYVDYTNVVNKPTLVSGSSQLTASYDSRYPLSSSVSTNLNTLNTFSSSTQTLYNNVYAYSGFINNGNLTVSYNWTNRTITITPTVGTIQYNWRGVLHDLGASWTSSAHTATVGQWYLSTNDGTTFSWSQTVWPFSDVMVADVYYRASAVTTFATRQVHGEMEAESHEEMHDMIGTYVDSGGKLTAGTYNFNSATDADTTPGFDAAVVKDEDIKTSLAAWTQGAYTTVYISGSTPVFATGSTTPFIATTNTYVQVNNTTTGTMTAGVNNRWYNVYQILVPTTSDTNSSAYRMIMLQPQSTFTSLAAALAEDTKGLVFGDFATQVSEYVLYSRITYSAATGNTNIGKCTIPTGGVTYVIGSKFSQTSVSGVSSTNHAALSNLTWLSSGHIGTATKVASFDGAGAAAELSDTITINSTGVALGGTITTATILGGSGVHSGSITGYLPAGTVSGSSQVLGGSGVWSGSAQLPVGTVSGSSQVVYTSLSSIPVGIISGSSQVVGSSITTNSITIAGNATALGGSITAATILGATGVHSGSIGDYQFNSIGVGTAGSTVAGEIRATADITAFYSSDIRLKENIIPIPNALDKVNQISGNTYDWKEGFEEYHSHIGNDVGVIAQEIEKILPQIVTDRDTGYKAVQYEKIIPLLIEAIKELSAKIDILENK